MLAEHSTTYRSAGHSSALMLALSVAVALGLNTPVMAVAERTLSD